MPAAAIFAIAAAAAAAAPVPSPAGAAVTVEVSPTLTTSGSYRVSWQTAADAHAHVRFEVQESSDSGFAEPRTLYVGPDGASVITGRGDGTYHYRVRVVSDGAGGANGAGWSETATVTVQHHALTRAFAFFAIGAIVFAATVGLVVRGTIATSRDERS